jgi:alpha-beta hydrolase superfamily lysophospholipase
MMYVPGPLSYGDDRSIIKIPSANGLAISVQLLENPASRYTILFSHGNAEDIGDLSWFLKEFYRRGFGVIVHDYSGYGTRRHDDSRCL